MGCLLTPMAECSRTALTLARIKCQLVLPRESWCARSWAEISGDGTGWRWRRCPGVPKVGQWRCALNTGLFSALLLLSSVSWAELWCQPCLIHHLCLSVCIEQALRTISFLVCFFCSFVLHLSAKCPEAQKGFWGNVCAVRIRIFLVKGKQATEMLSDNLHRPATASCQTSWAANVIWGETFLSQRNSQAFPRSPDASLTGRQGSAQLGHSLHSSDIAQRVSGEMLLLLQGLLWQPFVLSTQQLTTSIGTSRGFFFRIMTDNSSDRFLSSWHKCGGGWRKGSTKLWNVCACTESAKHHSLKVSFDNLRWWKEDGDKCVCICEGWELL